MTTQEMLDAIRQRKLDCLEVYMYAMNDSLGMHFWPPAAASKVTPDPAYGYYNLAQPAEPVSMDPEPAECKCDVWVSGCTCGVFKAEMRRKEQS